jgi:hypothetical protein
MTDLDRASLDRILPSTAGSPDWGDVMGRAGAAQSRHRRRLAAFAAVALVAVVGTTAALGRARDFMPLPFATPSGPESGELVLHWYGRSATYASDPGVPLVKTWVYADGRIVWRREGQTREGIPTGLVEQRLTSDGLELLRSRIVASGLFDRGRILVLPRDYAEGWGWGWAEVHRDDRIVRLQFAPDANHSPIRLGEGGTTATPEQVTAVRRVDALLTDPVSHLPSSAWADQEIRAYEPSHYAVCLHVSPPADVSRPLSALPARAEEVLRDESWRESESELIEALEDARTKVVGLEATYCAKVETGEARDVAEVVIGVDRDPLLHQQSYPLVGGARYPPGTRISFHPYLPHGEPPTVGA